MSYTRTIALAVLAMVAFAGNSLALPRGAQTCRHRCRKHRPIRLISGAAILGGIALMLREKRRAEGAQPIGPRAKFHPGESGMARGSSFDVSGAV